jgi:pimeloyl-ACP methyl ester carboxylesterase
MRVRKPAVLIAALSALGASCAQVKVWEVHPESAARSVRRVLGEHPYGRPDATRPAESLRDRPDSPDLTLASAVTLFETASVREVWSREDAIRLYADSMRFAYESMLDPRARDVEIGRSPHESEAQKYYNMSLERFLRLSADQKFHPDESWRSHLAELGIQVTIRQGADVWSPERIDELRFTGEFVVKGMDHYYGSDGLGVPLIAVRRLTTAELDSRQGPDRFLPFWEVYPVTAVLRFDRGAGAPPRAILELHDTLRFNQISLEGRPAKLAADLTTPTAYHFARGGLEKYEKVSLFTPEKLSREAGLHMLHPYERGKIPVVMIHGLASSPKAWGRVVNELRGDPALRARYQFWMYMYPTGSPFILSAAEFRKTLIEARQAVDPDATDSAYDRMVLIGHSMGGLLTRLAVTDSRDELWRLNSSRPFDNIIAAPEQRELLGRIFFFKPLPFVKRVVFIATPHLGSKLGNRFIGRLGDRLIQLPGPLEQTHNALIAQNEPGFFTPQFQLGVPTSIDELKFENPYLMTLKRLEVAPWVTAHSVIGKVGTGPLETSSDGVVPYASSHIEWSASELVVPRNHACQDAPQTVEELRRILFLHLQATAPPT